MIVAKVEAAGPGSFLMDLPLLENRFQFQRWLKDAKREPDRAKPQEE
jgi:sulfopyruvate decarboxylase subunit beta